MKSKTNDELIKIAQGIFHKEIFIDRYVQENEGQLLMNIFLPLAMMDAQQIEKMKNNPPAMIYEYYSKRMSMSINGYPCFSSCHLLNEADTEKVFHIVKQLEQSEKIIIERLKK